MGTPVRHSSGFGKSGLAEVVVAAKKIRCSFREGDTVIDILRDDAPDYIRTGTQFITLSADNDKLLYARPVNTSVPLRFIEFIKDDKGYPILKEREENHGKKSNGAKWTIPAHLEGMAKLEVSKGKWRGYILTMNVSYAFAQYEMTDITEVTGVMSTKTEEFMSQFGFDFMKDTLPWGENVLIPLEKILQARSELGVEPMGIINEKGWINKFVAPFEEEEVEDSEVAQLKRQLDQEETVTSGERTPAQKAMDDLYGETNKSGTVVLDELEGIEPEEDENGGIPEVFDTVKIAAKEKAAKEKAEAATAKVKPPEGTPPSAAEPVDQMMFILVELAIKGDPSATKILEAQAAAGNVQAQQCLASIKAANAK